MRICHNIAVTSDKSTISQNRQLKTLVMLIRDFSKDIQSFLNSKVANIPSHESIGIDLGIKDSAICSDGNKYQNINKSQVVKKIRKEKTQVAAFYIKQI